MSARFAVYIVAHHLPEQFAALVASLRHPRIDIYAHIDATVPQGPFVDALDERDAVVFVADTDRVRVHWGGLSQVRASLALFEVAARSGRGYHRHSLLSGVDVALRRPDELVETWSGNQEFVRIDRELLEQRFIRRVAYRHFPDRPTLAKLRLSGRFRTHKALHRTIFQGSNWMSTTDSTHRDIRAAIAADPAWLTDFRFTLCPDEFIFPSILAATGHLDRIAQNYLGVTDPDPFVHGQHYIDWSDDSAISPPELDARALAHALDGPALFARKVGADWTWRATSTIDTDSVGS